MGSFPGVRSVEALLCLDDLHHGTVSFFRQIPLKSHLNPTFSCLLEMDSQLVCEFQSLAGSETGCCAGSRSQRELGGLGSEAPCSLSGHLDAASPRLHIGLQSFKKVILLLMYHARLARRQLFTFSFFKKMAVLSGIMLIKIAFFEVEFFF